MLLNVLAAMSLRRWPHEDVERLVRKGLSGDEGAQAVALRHLKDRDLDISLEEVLPFLRSPNPDVREAADAAVERIRRSLEVRGWIASFGADARERSAEAVRANAVSSDPERRRAAAFGIAALGDPGGLALLFELLGDGDEGVRRAAAEAIERLGTRAESGR